jgi:hypothetical protein
MGAQISSILIFSKRDLSSAGKRMPTLRCGYRLRAGVIQ